MKNAILTRGFPDHRISMRWASGWPNQVHATLGMPDPPFTGGFLDLYARVTEMIRATEDSWTNEEVTAIEYLIASFYREYRNWSHPGQLRDHLEELHMRFRHLAALDLMAHAYLHMAYDLPRSIANALEEFTGSAAGETMRTRFLQLEPGFESIADEVASAADVLGRLAWLNRAMPRQWKLSYIFAIWVMRIRSNAYLCAETLHEMPHSRARWEPELLNEVQKRQIQVARARWSPLFWVRALGMPIMIAMAITSGWTPFGVAVFILAVLSVFFINDLTIYAELALRADSLGAATLTALVGTLVSPGETPRGASVGA